MPRADDCTAETSKPVSIFLDLSVHAAMVADRTRMTAYRQAIAEVVQPGDVVVDLGAGTGVLTAFACQAGASRVYAIERLPVIQVARELVKSAGYDDRVTFIESDFNQATLPERVDVIVSEVLGSFGVGETPLNDVINCRQRMLKSGGRTVPTCVRLWVAPVSDPEFHHDLSFCAAEKYQLDLSSARKLALNQSYGHRFKPDQLLAPPAVLGEIDLMRGDDDQSRYFDHTTEWAIEQSGEFHGVAGWFEAGLSTNTTLTNSPDGGASSWLQHFFPLQETVSVLPQDQAKLRLQMRCVGGDQFVWFWHTQVYRTVDGAPTKVAESEQSSFHGQLFSSGVLRRGALDFAPQLTAQGKLAAALLPHCDGEHTAAELTTLVRDMGDESSDGLAGEEVQKFLEQAWALGQIS